VDNYCCGMPIALRGPRKAMREKCERRGGSVNVAAAGTNVIRREAEVFVGAAEGHAGEV